MTAEVKEDEVVLVLGERRYRVRGLAKNTTPDVLKVNLLTSQADRFHVDNLDLYSARQRTAYVSQVATELGANPDAVKRELGQLLLQLEGLHEAQLRKATEPKEKTVTVGDADRERALELLKAPDLLERILRDFEKCGVVGEETNKLVGYLAAVSRKLEEPLAVIIQSSSAAGKSSLMDAVLALVPEEDRVKYSAMTGQSLFYMGDTNLKHKVLAIVEEEGASRASYALKLLQSEGEITIASTGKDPGTGRLVSQEYRVVGPVMLFLTTTAIDIDEELLNRCVVLTVDEEREQTRAIHRVQRERQTLEGFLARQQRQDVLRLHQNAQRLLKALPVINPYARHLTFLDDRTRTRRDHTKYLGLIRAVALLHQHQRPVKQARHGGVTIDYIEVQRQDIAVANRLCHEILGHSLDDLAPQTRRLLLTLDRQVTRDCEARVLLRSDFRFSRREVRGWTGWTDFQVRTHLGRLAALEYVLVHRGARGRSFDYELVYDGKGQDGQPFIPGLIDAETLAQHRYDAEFEGGGTEFEPRREGFEPPVSPVRGPVEPGVSSASGDEKPSEGAELPSGDGERAQTSHPGDINSAVTSYSQEVDTTDADAQGTP
ncbi:MAG: DNA primase [Actinomycetota bacterium]|nr:DNA primase [Actinomycetota bacterium]